MKKFGRRDYLLFCVAIGITVYALYINQNIQAQNSIYFPRPLSADDIQKYSNTDPKSVVIYPIFTQIAYKVGGFYDYYNGTCLDCNSISLDPMIINATYVTGLNGFDYLMQLHYPFITDDMVDKHPEILKEYDKIILLHNEYMTKTEFNAVKSHSNVIYLYPNSMYAEVSVNYDTMKMSLIRGHGYPDKHIGNGFGYDTSTNHEYDLNCKNYKWEERQNGIQPTCWPEFLIKSDRSVLQVIKDFPKIMPHTVSPPKEFYNVSNMGYCNQYGFCAPKP